MEKGKREHNLEFIENDSFNVSSKSLNCVSGLLGDIPDILGKIFPK